MRQAEEQLERKNVDLASVFNYAIKCFQSLASCSLLPHLSQIINFDLIFFLTVAGPRAHSCNTTGVNENSTSLNCVYFIYLLYDLFLEPLL